MQTADRCNREPGCRLCRALYRRRSWGRPGVARIPSNIPAANMYGNTIHMHLYRIDPETSIAYDIGPAGTDAITALGTAQGRLFSQILDPQTFAPVAVAEVDRLTGKPTLRACLRTRTSSSRSVIRRSRHSAQHSRAFPLRRASPRSGVAVCAEAGKMAAPLSPHSLLRWHPDAADTVLSGTHKFTESRHPDFPRSLASGICIIPPVMLRK